MAEYYLERLKPIAVALDRIQREGTLISETVYIWKSLKEELDDSISDKKEKDMFEKKKKKRIKLALTPAHYLAYILDPRYQGKDLHSEEKDAAEKFLCEAVPDFLPVMMLFCGKSKPFKEHYFSESVIKSVSPYAWWQYFKDDLSDDQHDLMQLPV